MCYLYIRTVGFISAGVLCVSETSSGAWPGLTGALGLETLTLSSTSIGYDKTMDILTKLSSRNGIYQ